MTTLNISLPDGLRAFVENQAAKEGYRDVSEYLQAVLRGLQERQARRELEERLLEGLQSPVVEMTDAHWQELERQVRERSPVL